MNTVETPLATLHLTCTSCGHSQSTEAIHPTFERTPEGVFLTDYLVGTSGAYCEACDGPVEVTGLTVDQLHPQFAYWMEKVS